MSQNKQVTKLHIFVASPGDVKPEREIVHAVAAELSRDGNVASQLGMTLEVLDWRNVTPKMGRPQQVILDELKAKKWDIFMGILWQRFGNDTGKVDPQTGRTFGSGTVEEFKTAYRLWKKTKTRRPQISFYRCNRPIDADQADLDQVKKVREFFGNFDAKKKSPGLYQTFLTRDDFEQQIRSDLTKYLFEHRKMYCTICNGDFIESIGRYLSFNDKNPIIIENVPARVCKKCGERRFEPPTITGIQMIDWKKVKAKRTRNILIYDYNDRQVKALLKDKEGIAL